MCFLFVTNISRQVVSPSFTSKTLQSVVTRYQLPPSPAVIHSFLGHSPLFLKYFSGSTVNPSNTFLVVSIFTTQPDNLTHGPLSSIPLPPPTTVASTVSQSLTPPITDILSPTSIPHCSYLSNSLLLVIWTPQSSVQDFWSLLWPFTPL